ncbi:Sulfotransferase [Trinorchestia longiramus]|nr:Sulfotransferase [Trinorchestia longiramus]
MTPKNSLGNAVKTPCQNSCLGITTQAIHVNETKSAVKNDFFLRKNRTLHHVSTDMLPYSPSAAQNAVPDNREDVFASRRDLVLQGCQRYGVQASYSVGSESHNMKLVPLQQLRWHKKRDMVVCFSAKVGTSTWLEYLLQDKYPPSQYLQWKRNPDNSMHLIAEKTLKPEFPGQPTCYGKTYIKMWKSMLTFKSFIEFVVRTVPASTAADIKTFSLFDRHWRPYYLNCAVCDIDYDYIVKMETWDEDIKYILDKFGFKNDEYSHKNRRDSDTVALEYIKALPKSLILQLYKLYSIDFEMFGYTIDAYLQ